MILQFCAYMRLTNVLFLELPANFPAWCIYRIVRWTIVYVTAYLLFFGIERGPFLYMLSSKACPDASLTNILDSKCFKNYHEVHSLRTYVRSSRASYDSSFSSSFVCLFFILSFLHIRLSKVNTDYIRQAQIKNIDKTKKVVMKHSGRNHKITSLKYQF